MSHSAPANPPTYAPGPGMATPPSPPASKPLLSDTDHHMNSPPSPPQAPQPWPQHQHRHNDDPENHPRPAPQAGKPSFWPASGWNQTYSPGVGQYLPGGISRGGGNNNDGGGARGGRRRGVARPAPEVVSSCNVIPVPLVGRWPAVVHCPACDGVGLTEVRYRVGMGAHAMAAILLFTTGIGVVVPYIAPQCKDVEHSCGGCKNVLATYWFLGGTEAHMF